MRDEKDPGTTDLLARPGRPALYGSPMTTAERSRRYREARHDRMRVAMRDPSRASDVGLQEELKACMCAGDNRSVHRILAELGRRFPVE